MATSPWVKRRVSASGTGATRVGPGRAAPLLLAAAWLATATPAWANAVDPELYPEAAEEYNRMMTTTFGIVFGCFGLIVIVSVALVVGLIVWLVRREKRTHAEAGAPANTPPLTPPPLVPAVPPADETAAPPTP